VVGTRIAHERFDPPLSETARDVVVRRIGRARHQLEDRLSADDLDALDVLGDADDARGVAHRADVFVAASRQIVVARIA
jgi:hypothetical protein